MPFSHVFLTRPRAQSEELAMSLKALGLQTVVQPAFTYSALGAAAEQPREHDALAAAGAGDLLLFTSPRAVEHGLAQLPGGVLGRARIGAIGPATARALENAGVRVGVRAAGGYTSEALLETLAAEIRAGDRRAFIMAAPGGRGELARGLKELGWDARTLYVYRSTPAPLDRDALAELESASGILSVWTSGNAMKALSQRLPPASWFRICQGEWLVISDRLQRLARAYGPANVHLAGGPGNPAILSAIRSLL
jgi:uroporphyrinogen-III synthase